MANTSVIELIKCAEIANFDTDDMLKVYQIDENSIENVQFLSIEELETVPSSKVIERAIGKQKSVVKIQNYGYLQRCDLFRLRNVHRSIAIAQEAKRGLHWTIESFDNKIDAVELFQKPWTAVSTFVCDKEKCLRIALQTRDFVSVMDHNWNTDSVLFSVMALVTRNSNAIPFEPLFMSLIMEDSEQVQNFQIKPAKNSVDSPACTC
jgi:hypothetical protein